MTSRQPPATLLPLPVRVRPRNGETVASYVRRLARANHLKPSYLHSLLRPTPMNCIQANRLAALSGRPAWTLAQALAGLAMEPGSDPLRLVHTRQPWPPPRWPGPVITQVRPLMDTWLSEDPPLTPAQVWKRLVDDHDVDITYGTVAQYTARSRRRDRPAGGFVPEN
jgi:TniQ